MGVAAPAPVCTFERVHGRPCMICRAPHQDARPDVAPEHPEHLALAESADRLAAQALYAERGLHLFEPELRDLTSNERLVLDSWAAGRGPLGAHFAARAHVAGVVTELDGEPPMQACTRCRLMLQDHAVLVADGAYPVGAHVGLDCEGKPLPAEEALDYGD